MAAAHLRARVETVGRTRELRSMLAPPRCNLTGNGSSVADPLAPGLQADICLKLKTKEYAFSNISTRSNYSLLRLIDIC